MSEENFIVSTEGLGTFTPYEGDGPAAWLAYDGDYKVRIKKATPGRVEATGNLKLDLVLEILDECEDMGRTLYRTVTCSGEVQSGPNKGEKNIKQLGKVLYSAGRSVEQVRGIEKDATLDLREAAKGLTTEGKNIAYIHGVTSRNTQGRNAGQYRTEVLYFIDKAAYDTNVGSGGHRIPRGIQKADERYAQATATSSAGKEDQAVSKASNGASAVSHAEASKAAEGI